MAIEIILSFLYHNQSELSFLNTGVAANRPTHVMTLHLEPPLLKFLESPHITDNLSFWLFFLLNGTVATSSASLQTVIVFFLF